MTLLNPTPSPTIRMSDSITGGNDIHTSTMRPMIQSTTPPK